MKNGSDTFERALKDSLESYEVPYNSADWAQLEKELNKGTSKWKASAGLLALLLGGTLTMATVVYFAISQGHGTEDPLAAAALSTNQTDPNGAGDESVTLTEESSTAPMVDGTNGAQNTATLGSTTVLDKPSAGSARPSVDPATTAPVVPAASVNTSDIAIRPSMLTGCPGASVEFTVDNLPSDGTFLWNFGDGSFSRDAKPKHTFSKAGRFEVMLSHSSVGGGTIHNKPVSDVIVIHEIPEASFNMLKQEYENSIPSVHFENRSIGSQSYAWDFGDGATSTVSHPSHVYKKAGTYTVSLMVTNGAGCTDRMEKTLRIEEDYNLLAAKTFSPNADGMEDTFVPEALKTLGVKFHMTVHKGETGQLVFETSDAQRPWNGRIGGRGENCAPGDYIWMVEMKDGDKLGGTYNGTVSLLR